MALYRHLSEISLQDVLEFGGKAAHLGEAVRLGCPVLPGVVLSSELYRRFMRQGGLQGEIRSILNNLQPRTIVQFQAAEWAIQSAFRVRRMPGEVVDTIHEAWEALGAPRVAIRSSATNEDSPGQSFVGQHAVILDVKSPEAAMEAVLECWASLYSARALSYAHSFGIDLLNSAMAVLIQPMVDPCASGVLSTVDPVTGNPDIFILSIQSGPQSGVYRLDPYASLEERPPFWRQLRDIGLLLEEHYLAYQSLEWIWADEHVFLLGVRPIINIPPYLPSEAIRDVMGEAPLQWMHPSDISPRAAHPFSWYHQSRSPVRMKAYQESPAPIDSPTPKEHYLCGYLYMAPEGQPPKARLQRPLGRWLRNGIFALRARNLDQHYLALRESQIQRLTALNDFPLEKASSAEIAALLQEIDVLHNTFTTQWGLLERTYKALWEILHEAHFDWLPKGMPDNLEQVIPSGAMKELIRLAQASYTSPEEKEAVKTQFFHTYRYLFVPDDALAPWQDISDITPDRNRFEQAWHSAETGSIANAPARSEENDHPYGSEAFSGLYWWRRKIYTALWQSIRHYFTLCRDCQGKVILCRLLERDILLEVGKRLMARGILSSENEAVFLEYQEILNWLQGTVSDADIAATVSKRKALMRRWTRYTPPALIAPSTRALRIEERPSDERLEGQPICAGQASGTARVLCNPHDASHVLPGEILVCQEFLFELSPLLSIVSAVITERGDLLDHASILVREYGVPAVFGVAKATMRIQTGDILLLDATQGTIIRRARETSWGNWVI